MGPENSRKLIPRIFNSTKNNPFNFSYTRQKGQKYVCWPPNTFLKKLWAKIWKFNFFCNVDVMVQRAWEGPDKNFILHSPVTFRIAIIWPERGVSKKLKKINVPFYLMYFCLVVHSLCIAPSTDSWHGRNTLNLTWKRLWRWELLILVKKGQKTLYVEKKIWDNYNVVKTLQKMASNFAKNGLNCTSF